MKIRVLHVIDHLGYGGAPFEVKNIAENVGNGNVEVLVCALRANPRPLPIDATIINLGCGKYNPLVIRAIAKLCREHKIDIIHAHLAKSVISSLIASYFIDAKVVIHEHGGIFLGGANIVFTLLLKALAKRASMVIANSRASMTALHEKAGIALNSIRIIHNFVDFARFDRTLYDRNRARDRLGISENQVAVGFVGRLDPCKGADLLIRAAAILCRKSDLYRFVIVGEGPQRRELEQLVLRLGLDKKVMLAGLCENPAELMAAFDVAAVPSRHEAFGIAAVEFMRMNIPVVASVAGGLPEIVEHEKTGLRLGELSPDSIAQAVERVARDEALRQRLTREAELFSRKFDGREQIRQLLEIYEKLCA